MSRVSLDSYYKVFFKGKSKNCHEQFKAINRGHVISSKYYDVQFGRVSLIYRDETHKLIVPVEHDTMHTLVIYIHYFMENNVCDISKSYLQERLSAALNFLQVKYQFE